MESYWKDRYLDTIKQLQSLRTQNQKLTQDLATALEEAEFHKERTKVLETELKRLQGPQDIPSLSMSSICGLSSSVERRMKRKTSVRHGIPKIQAQPQVTRLYENFFILGAIDPSMPSPELAILHQFPAECKFNPQTLLSFAFPEGYSCVQVDMSDSGSSFYSLFYAKYERDSRSFVFTIKSPESLAPCEFEMANRDREVLYCCCVIADELLNSDVSSISEMIVFPKVYCVVSYLPCFDLHFEVLYQFLTIKKFHRMSEINQETSPKSTMHRESLRTSASWHENERFEDLFEEQINLMADYYESSPSGVVRLDLVTVPGIEHPLNQLEIKDCIWACPVLFSQLTFDDFLLVLGAAMHERSIVFISRNLDYLSSSVLGIIGLMQPFKWPHLVCPVLPESLLDLLDAPVPFIGGILKTPPNPEDNPDIVWVNLDAPNKNTRVKTELAEQPQSPSLRAALEHPYTAFQSSDQYELDDIKADALQNVIETVKTHWMDLISRIPPTIDSEDISMNHVRAAILALTDSTESKFIEGVVETQFFTGAVERIYGLNT